MALASSQRSLGKCRLGKQFEPRRRLSRIIPYRRIAPGNKGLPWPHNGPLVPPWWRPTSSTLQAAPCWANGVRLTRFTSSVAAREGSGAATITSVDYTFRRLRITPRSANPVAIIAYVPGSGTPVAGEYTVNRLLRLPLGDPGRSGPMTRSPWLVV